MSRVIKFRGYDLEYKCWRYGHCFSGYATGAEFIIEGGVFYEVAPESVGQFTGLTDCNGVEIYEGGIVKAFCNINKISSPALTERDPEYDLKLVMYMKGGFVLSTEKYNFCGVLGFNGSTMPSDLTVVGNIYEHPHLLNHSSEQA